MPDQRDIEALLDALELAWGEAYLGTLDSDDVPSPMRACENVIAVCRRALSAFRPLPEPPDLYGLTHRLRALRQRREVAALEPTLKRLGDAINGTIGGTGTP